MSLYQILVTNMAEAGYKQLISYKLAQIAFDLGWDFVPQYYSKYEDGRQRDQIKQALRSDKQNIVEGSSERSLSSKLKLYDVAKSSGMEALEDFEDILRREGLPHWDKDDPRLKKLRQIFEGYPSPPSNPYNPPTPSCSSVLEVLGGLEGREGIEAITNYLVDLLTRSGYLLDKQINAVEEKHQKEGGYNENLLKKRLAFKKSLLSLILLFPLLLLIPLFSPSPALATNSNNFTLSIWVNPTTSVASKTILSKAEEFRMFTDASGFVGCQIKSTTWQTAAQASTQALTVGSWSHVVCTYDQTYLTVYVNGIQVAQTALTAAVDDTANALKIGQDDSASTPYSNLSGTIDEFKFYNYALTANEVKIDMNQGSSESLGAMGNNSTYQPQAANQEYCVPGDTTSCAAPVGEWKMEDKTSQTVVDTGTAGVNGVLGTNTNIETSDPTWAIGKYGGGLNFINANNQRVTLGTNSVFNLTGDLTIEGWIKPSSVSVSGSIFVREAFQTGGFKLMLSGYGNQMSYATDDPGHQYGVVWPNTIYPNIWQHVALTQSGSTATLYINGISQGGKTINPPASASTTTASFGNGISGILDEVKVFNYARTPAQIAYDYNRGGPVAYWDFDECSGGSVHDLSGNNNTGTINLGTGGTQTTTIGNGDCNTNAQTPWYNGAIGKFNSSLNFDGTDDYVSGNASPMTNTDNFTLSAWIYPKALPQNNAFMVFNGNDCAGYGFAIADGAGGSGSKLQGGIGGVAYVDSGYTFPSINTWYHVVETRNNGTMSFYVNGIKTPNTFTYTPHTPATHFSIGSHLDCSNNPIRYFNGQIDDARMYNYPLTPVQVKLLYNNGSLFFGPSTGAP